MIAGSVAGRAGGAHTVSVKLSVVIGLAGVVAVALILTYTVLSPSYTVAATNGTQLPPNATSRVAGSIPLQLIVLLVSSAVQFGAPGGTSGGVSGVVTGGTDFSTSGFGSYSVQITVDDTRVVLYVVLRS